MMSWPISACAGSTVSICGAVKKKRFTSHPASSSASRPPSAEGEQLHVHVGHAQRAALAARRAPGLSRGPGRAGPGLGQRFPRRRRRERRRVGDRPLGDLEPDLGRRRRDLAVGGDELDHVAVEEGRRLDRLAVDPGALAAPVVDHRDAEVVPDDLDVGELDLGVVEPQVGEAARADDHGQARGQLDVVAVEVVRRRPRPKAAPAPRRTSCPSPGEAAPRRADDSRPCPARPAPSASRGRRRARARGAAAAAPAGRRRSRATRSTASTKSAPRPSTW